MVSDHDLLLISTACAAISVVAAAFAVGFAWKTVSDTRVFHQEQERDTERARLLAIAETLAELASIAYTVGVGGGADFGLLRARHARFKAAVETTAEPIPVCRSLAAFPVPPEGRPYEEAGRMNSQTAAAADELHATIKRLAVSA